ncbi:MAG: ATPase [Thermotoga sp.]|nr:MAG: ATPase [Thermotogota bacterium]RKX57159.1 MAG: ATPase [Thermotoga sp.]
MKKEMAREILRSLFDEPISSEELLVDRENEIRFLNMVCSLQPKGTYGVCGETGIGKTTVLNFLNPDRGIRIYLKLTEKENKEVIIGDMLYKLAKEVEEFDDDKISKLAKEARKFVVEERSIGSSLKAGVNVFVNGGITKTMSYTRKFNVYQAYDFMDRLLDVLLKEYGRLVLLIDELDKEKKEDVLMILDSLKSIFDKEGLITIISLPFAIYREYARDRLRWNESGNLENILKDTIFLEPLEDEQIQEMILRRLKKYPDFFDNDALYEISRYSDGNPRDALWISQQIVLDNLDKDRITGDTAVKTIKKVVRRHFKDMWELTEIQESVLKVVAQERGNKSALVKKLEERGIKRQTAYTYINRLKENGLIIERNGVLKVVGKMYYLIED